MNHEDFKIISGDNQHTVEKETNDFLKKGYLIFNTTSVYSDYVGVIHTVYLYKLVRTSEAD